LVAKHLALRSFGPAKGAGPQDDTCPAGDASISTPGR
jgi:hypothetical protein